MVSRRAAKGPGIIAGGSSGHRHPKILALVYPRQGIGRIETVMKDDRLYLIHIKEAIGWIEEYTHDGKDIFFKDHKTQDAVLRNLHTLFESVQRLSTPLKDKHPEVDWRVIAGFRNVIVHDYFGIDLDQIWDVVRDDLPELKRAIQKILDDIKD